MTNRLAQDPRLDPRIKAMFGQVPPTLLPDLPNRAAIIAHVAQNAVVEQEPAAADHAPFEAIAPLEGLDIHTEAIASQPDGNSINLQIIRPAGGRDLPCVYYVHGGGMMMGSCYDPMHAAWGRLLAAQGVAVVMVDFRNCLTPSSVPEIAPFPAGLNDCVAGLRWLVAHAETLDIDRRRIVVAGESGGANLALATGLQLKRDGDLGMVAGFYVMCPYLAGEWPGEAGSSALENAGILMQARSSYGPIAYDIEQVRLRNPLAWPGFATVDDVAGFPPVVISVNECDPLRDDGVAFYRLLLRAGVPARAKIVLGTVHATEIICLACPDISRAAAREIADFCSHG